MLFKQQIKNPYKINYKLYLFLIIISIIIMYIGYTININNYQFVSEIILLRLEMLKIRTRKPMIYIEIHILN